MRWFWIQEAFHIRTPMVSSRPELSFAWGNNHSTWENVDSTWCNQICTQILLWDLCGFSHSTTEIFHWINVDWALESAYLMGFTNHFTSILLGWWYNKWGVISFGWEILEFIYPMVIGSTCVYAMKIWIWSKDYTRRPDMMLIISDIDHFEGWKAMGI